jgi:hypothetical protein
MLNRYEAKTLQDNLEDPGRAGRFFDHLLPGCAVRE